MAITPLSSSVIDVPFRVLKTQDPKPDYVAYKDASLDRAELRKIERDQQDQIRAIENAEKINLDRQPKVAFDITDIPLLSAAQNVTPLVRTQVQNYIRANKIPIGHYIDLDV